MIRNKKSQTGITIIFWVIIFSVLWSLGLGNLLNQQIAIAITQNSLTGIEAFILSYFNLIFYMIMIIFVVAGLYIE